jgi:CRP-like cAMP-binding protein
LSAKSGFVDFKSWYKDAFGDHTPWGDLDSPALVTAVETSLERELSRAIMRNGAKPSVKKIRAGAELVRQGEAGHELFVLLDGVLGIEVDGVELGALGPGAMLGERSTLEGGLRTATLRAVTPCKVAVATAADIDSDALGQLAAGHRREEPIG